MDTKTTENPDSQSDEDQAALESPATTEESQAPAADLAADPSSVDTTADTPGGSQPHEQSKAKGLRRLFAHVNIYLLMLVVVLGLAIFGVLITYMANKRDSGITEIPSQNISGSLFEELANNGTAVGSSDEVLNVQSSAVFAGRVLLRQDLEVAGNLQIGQTLSLNNVSVTGTAQVSQLQTSKDLSVGGNSSVQGNATVGKSLQVNGNGSFSGSITAAQITTPSLQLNGELVLNRHITVGGATPGRTSGGALGSGGTSSLSGSDTSGSITINTGGAPASGCFITVNFASRFSATPRVILTPVGSGAADLNYYVNRTSASFSVCTTTPAAAGTTFGFDYWVAG